MIINRLTIPLFKLDIQAALFSQCIAHLTTHVFTFSCSSSHYSLSSAATSPHRLIIYINATLSINLRFSIT